MRFEVKKILLKLYQQHQEDEILRDILTRLINFEGALEDLDVQLLIRNGLDDEKKDVKWPVETSEFIDARICTLSFENFRAFPDKNYGISFLQKHEGKDIACSLFLVGSNSNGKSTICDALEYAYTGDVAAVHRLKGVDLYKYLTYGFEEAKVKKEDVRLTLRVMDKQEPSVINLTSPIEPYCTASSFCSDNDVEELERCDENIEGYLLSQLGYSELPILKKKLDELVKVIEGDINRANSSTLSATDIRKVIEAYLKVYHFNSKKTDVERFRDSSSLNRFVKRIRDKYTEIKKDTNNKDRLAEIRRTLNRIPVDYFTEEWNLLINNIILEEQSPANISVRPVISLPPDSKKEELVDAKKPTPVKASMEKLLRLYERLYRMLSEPDGLDNIYQELANINYGGLADTTIKPEERQRLSLYAANMKQLSFLIESEIGRICDDFYKENNDYLSTTMNSFSRSTEKFMLVNAGGHLSAKISSTENGGFFGSPKSYYNTFRYKLFVIALKISLSFLYMRNRKVVVPIVIDDVFNATDFDNSIKLERFVYHIYKTYEEKVKSGFPLQLIVLTHDEMVMTAFRKGAKLMHDYKNVFEAKRQPQFAGIDFICGRLFHYTQAKELSVRLKTKTNFANLYLPI